MVTNCLYPKQKRLGVSKIAVSLDTSFPQTTLWNLELQMCPSSKAKRKYPRRRLKPTPSSETGSYTTHSSVARSRCSKTTISANLQVWPFQPTNLLVLRPFIIVTQRMIDGLLQYLIALSRLDMSVRQLASKAAEVTR